MTRISTALAIVTAFSLALAGAASGQAPGAPGNPGTTSPIAPKDAPPPVATPPGPYTVTIEANPSLPTHTIYRPADLGPFTGDHGLPIVAWGNGACSNAGLMFKTFLTQIASNGFMVISAGAKDTPMPRFDAPKPGGSAVILPPPAMTNDADLKTAIDWAIAENQRRGSPYFHRLDPDKVAVMGQSCGGLQTIVVSADPRVKTSIVWNSGVLPDGGIGRSISGATKASLAGFHAPVAYINGGPADAAYVNALDDLSRIHGVPVFFGWINVGHGGVYNQPGGGRFGAVGVAWLKWRLNGDQAAGKLFDGPDCGLCKDPVWHVQKKDMP